MSLATIDLVIIGAFLTLVTVMGVALSRLASQGIGNYFLGGRKIPWWLLGGSTATSNFDMAGTMIIVAVVFSLGYKGFLVEFRGGVGLSLALLVIFLGKWLRRSRVMTPAEWMKLRFGDDKQGRTAHAVSAGANLILSLGMIVYFAAGAGAFLSAYLPFDELTCASILVFVGLVYTLLSGLYGVVFTDIVQMAIMIFGALFITVEAFLLVPGLDLPSGFLELNLDSVPAGGELGAGLLALDGDRWETIFQFFGLFVFMWFLRSVLEGMGGVGGYTDQRFFAARNEREGSLIAFQALILSFFRWTMVAGLVVMGYAVVAGGGDGAAMISSNPESVLPVVIGEMLPAGVRGLVLAGLVAAALSTFDSTLNAGASYVVRDIYQTYLRPEATQKQLIVVSRWATVGLCVAGIALTALVPNINTIWGIVTMGIGAGLFVPLVLRWYWPRYNGYGFAAGTAGGLFAGLLTNAVLAWPVIVSFPLIVGTAFSFSVIGSLITPPTSDRVLLRFARQINPWGFWGRYNKKLADDGLITEDEAGRRTSEKFNDMLAIVFSLPFQIGLLITAMSFVFRDWPTFGLFLSITIVSAIALYFLWYRNLRSEAECAAVEAELDAEEAEAASEAQRG